MGSRSGLVSLVSSSAIFFDGLAQLAIVLNQPRVADVVVFCPLNVGFLKTVADSDKATWAD